MSDVTTLEALLEGQDPGVRRLLTTAGALTHRIRAEIPKALGTTQGVNVYGERQLAIDVWANDLFCRTLADTGLVRFIGSEELESPIVTDKGDYSVVLDPIDGSSNVESNNPLATILGVYHDTPLPARGRDLLASAYVLYGPYLEMVLALPEGVYDLASRGGTEGSGGFIVMGERLRLPSPPTVYGVGGLRPRWTPRVRAFVEGLERKGLKLRYGGAFAADFNQVLKKGGFFAYPELTDAPEGKYRLQYESNPLAFITEKAGGRGTTGHGRILDVQPTTHAQRVPTYVGDAALVEELEASFRSTAPGGPEAPGKA